MNWIVNLKRLGVKVFPKAKFIPEEGTLEFDILTNEQREVLFTPFEKQKVGIIETTPFDFHLIDNDFKIANTMIESDRMGKPWVDACNSMDLVVVPNEFQKLAFETSGVRVPLRVIRHGTWTEMFPYYERPKREIFTFGIVGWLNERKGVFDVIRAFSSEFKPKEPVRLYLKSSNPDFGYYSQFNDSRITTDTRHISPSELRDIYNSFDCFVFPSKAEGVGQPPREAMSTGLPTIVTNYSGLEEISEYGYALQPTELVEGINPQVIEQPGNWANIDIQELMYFMRYIYEHQDKARKIGKKASQEINEKHSWPACASSMVDLLKEVCND